jgi:hypothetical protein
LAARCAPILLVGGLIASCKKAPAPTLAVDATPVLGSTEPADAAVASIIPELPASDGNQFRVFVAPCRDGACPIEIALVRGGTVLSRAALAWPSATETLSAQPTVRGQGVGDPLETPETTSWTSGEEERAVTSTFRSVKLSGDRRGVLVAQYGGFEHVKRRHALYVAEAGKVRLVWEGTEGAGPTYSTTALVEQGDADVIVFFHGFMNPDETEPEMISATALSWAEAGSEVRPIAARDVVHALAVGDFGSARQARAARAAQPCLGEYWAVKLKRRHALVAMSTRRHLLEDLAAKTRACAPKLKQRFIDPASPVEHQ